MNAEIERLNKVIADKDKLIKTQALSLRELVHDEFRGETIRKNYDELDRLA